MRLTSRGCEASSSNSCLPVSSFSKPKISAILPDYGLFEAYITRYVAKALHEKLLVVARHAPLRAVAPSGDSLSFDEPEAGMTLPKVGFFWLTSPTLCARH